MEWSDAVERNREALKRLVASLVAMAAMTIGQRGIGAESSEADQASDNATTLPRHVHRAIVRLLRPAEAAARRLIITVARGLVVTLPPPRPQKPRPKSSFAHKGGTGIILPRGVTMPPPTPRFAWSPSPVNGGRSGAADGRDAGSSPAERGRGTDEVGGGGGVRSHPRKLSFPLLDPLRLPRLRRPSLTSVPRISAPGFGTPFPIPVRKPPSRDDPLSSRRLNLRLAALASALDDMPRHALRFARWKARRERERRQGIAGRAGPLRPGRPPGGRLKRWDPTAIRGRRVREVDDILAHAHALALVALEQRPDTS